MENGNYKLHVEDQNGSSHNQTCTLRKWNEAPRIHAWSKTHVLSAEI